MAQIKKRWTPSNWSSWKPFGIGEQRPNNYKEIVRAIAESRGELPFAWRILSQGVCDGCALGTTGMKDWTLPGTHLCNIRLRLLKLNTMGPLDPARLADAAALAAMPSAALRDLGRLPYPMLRERGDAGFRRIGWDEALDRIARRLADAAPDRIGAYLTSRGMPNEAYYAAQKAMRAIGTNNIDNAARICHSPSTVALKQSMGVAATTCSYSDWLEADLITFIGSNVANNQPVATKYLHYAKKNGARVAVINTYREPGMANYWIPSVPESALFGTRIADDFYLIDNGSDVAFLQGVLKHLIDEGAVDADFIAKKTEGFEALRADLAGLAWEELEARTGAGRDAMMRYADQLAAARKAVFVWSMGITQHACGVDNVQAIVNLALARGFVGRAGCGLMPIRGHSGVQGGAEMGAYATAFPGGRPINPETAAELEALWGFAPPSAPGIMAADMLDAAGAGTMDAMISVGGNFLEVMPDPVEARAALARVPLRVHMDIVLSSQMLVEPAEAVILLPAATRYETPGGVTQTSTERRVMFSPEITGRRIGEARPEWDVFLDLARRTRPDRAEWLALDSTAAVRDEIARVIPAYDGIQRLAKQGDQFQYGGPHLCAGGVFPTPTGKAHFRTPALPAAAQRAGDEFLVTTRRGKQFNSMIQEQTDAITGADRDHILMAPADADRLGLRDGDRAALCNEHGRFEGRILRAPVQPGNLHIHWPEGNGLLDPRKRSPEAGVPDYNAAVRLETFAKDTVE